MDTCAGENSGISRDSFVVDIDLSRRGVHSYFQIFTICYAKLRKLFTKSHFCNVDSQVNNFPNGIASKKSNVQQFESVIKKTNQNNA